MFKAVRLEDVQIIQDRDPSADDFWKLVMSSFSNVCLVLCESSRCRSKGSTTLERRLSS